MIYPKLSDAILAGCIVAPVKAMRCFIYPTDETKPPQEACAWGAGLIGLFGEDGAREVLTAGRIRSALASKIGVPMDTTFENPVTRNLEYLYTIIVFLNDVQHWTREDIAAWLHTEGL